MHDHIGFMHEAFEALEGARESVYINFQPTRMGATTYLRRKEGRLEAGEVREGEMEWVRPLVDANRGLLRTSLGRSGQMGK